MVLRWKAAALPVVSMMLAALLVACEEQNTYVEPPLPKVTVARPLVQNVTDFLELTGTTAASAEVEVRARVPGVLQSMHFKPGVQVTAGDLLFVINPEEYEADLKAAQAELARAKALLENSSKTLTRAKTLREKGHVSEAKVDEAEAEARAAEAEVLVRQSALNRAEINLGYTEVKVPVSGRVGRNLVDLGNLVGEGEATVLTEITVQHPMYVYINLNELDLLKVADAFKKRVRERKIDVSKEETKRAGLEVFLGLSDEEGYPHKGIVDFAESGLDPDTGTLQLRATFDNSKQPPDLYPGLFGRIRLPIADRQDMPLVADSAVGTDQSGTYLLVVNQKDVVEKRNVDLGQLVDGLRVIEKGLAPEDRIVVNGLQRARPGAQVDPEETEMQSLASSATTDKPAAAQAGGDLDAAAAETASSEGDTAEGTATEAPESQQ